VCVYVVIRSTLLEQDGDLPRRRVPEVSFVPFFYGSTHVVLCSPTESCLSIWFFVVIRLIQVMIEIDHVKMDVIVEVKDGYAPRPLGQKAQGTAA
jgi:hypothetical protein